MTVKESRHRRCLTVTFTFRPSAIICLMAGTPSFVAGILIITFGLLILLSYETETDSVRLQADKRVHHERILQLTLDLTAIQEFCVLLFLPNVRQTVRSRARWVQLSGSIITSHAGSAPSR